MPRLPRARRAARGDAHGRAPPELHEHVRGKRLLLGQPTLGLGVLRLAAVEQQIRQLHRPRAGVGAATGGQSASRRSGHAARCGSRDCLRPPRRDRSGGEDQCQQRRTGCPISLVERTERASSSTAPSASSPRGRRRAPRTQVTRRFGDSVGFARAGRRTLSNAVGDRNRAVVQRLRLDREARGSARSPRRHSGARRAPRRPASSSKGTRASGRAERELGPAEPAGVCRALELGDRRVSVRNGVVE